LPFPICLFPPAFSCLPFFTRLPFFAYLPIYLFAFFRLPFPAYLFLFAFFCLPFPAYLPARFLIYKINLLAAF